MSNFPIYTVNREEEEGSDSPAGQSQGDVLAIRRGYPGSLEGERLLAYKRKLHSPRSPWRGSATVTNLTERDPMSSVTSTPATKGLEGIVATTTPLVRARVMSLRYAAVTPAAWKASAFGRIKESCTLRAPPGVVPQR